MFPIAWAFVSHYVLTKVELSFILTIKGPKANMLFYWGWPTFQKNIVMRQSTWLLKSVN
jgi:hypothetical protein